MKLEDIAAHLEFCARTGNEERGLDVLHRNLDRIGFDCRYVDEMWTAAAAALLCRRVCAAGLHTRAALAIADGEGEGEGG